jgi:hypothetical protein
VVLKCWRLLGTEALNEKNEKEELRIGVKVKAAKELRADLTARAHASTINLNFEHLT